MATYICYSVNSKSLNARVKQQSFSQDFPVLGNVKIKSQDFPGFPVPVRTPSGGGEGGEGGGKGVQ